ncbi:armadillo-type protein [Absidia repens]|uniref:Armadillo-type protein n=1 Tax=Absidia repens TaxID=90262 RepID=A0A1X2IH06_9FUNG|nr:armadillo-type protein [Absidia repens]
MIHSQEANFMLPLNAFPCRSMKTRTLKTTPIKKLKANIPIMMILKTTDQQSSVFLQQRLKTSSVEQRQIIFECIYREAYGLMTNRFGNFLVQRIFELGTPEQIRLLAHTMKGRVLALTCEHFGCHVVQKALDYVDEKTKAMLVTELFENIPETVTHKSACHVWQKIFEIRWVHHPVKVMAHMHEALKGRWTEVALDETGSLVIQNIFENLSEPEKRPVINEVLDNMFTIARGQWGNWVIQHILEHAEYSKDRELAFEMVLHRGIQLSMDQFASKVVEKALSIGGPCYMSKFIHHISTSSRSQRPRIALIDIAGDQYGNYVIQWVINNANENYKIEVCKLIKKHMVSLRGSKYGQRVALLVDKALKRHEITTYPAS